MSTPREMRTLKSIFSFTRRLIEELELALIPPEAARISFTIQTSDGIILEITKMQMKVTQTLPLSIKPVDAFGNAAVVDGAPVWSLSDPALGALAVAADGLSAVFTPAGALGSLQVVVSADADLGAGVKTIIGQLPVDLLAGDAVAVQVAAGAPIDPVV